MHPVLCIKQNSGTFKHIPEGLCTRRQTGKPTIIWRERLCRVLRRRGLEESQQSDLTLCRVEVERVVKTRLTSVGAGLLERKVCG